MYSVSIQKTVVDTETGDEFVYTFSALADSEVTATQQVCNYASMVEFGTLYEKWGPKELPFPREQLYQFIQPAQLSMLESMYPEVISTAYMNALAYVQSYIGAMFDVRAMLEQNDTTSTSLTLRLALAISTVTYILASSPQYAETIELHNKQLHMLLRGLKSGNRNFGKGGIPGDPDVRVTIVKLDKTGAKP